MKVNELLVEGRVPGFNYIEKVVKKVVDRVTLALSDLQHPEFVKLARRWYQLKLTVDRMTVLLNERNAQMKSAFGELFDAEDLALTKVIETSDLIITLSKETKAADKEPEYDTNYEQVVKELTKMVPELDQQLKDLIAKHTKLVPAKDTVAKLSVKPRELDENAGVNMVRILARIYASVANWAKGYDARLARLKAMVA